MEQALIMTDNANVCLGPAVASETRNLAKVSDDCRSKPAIGVDGNHKRQEAKNLVLIRRFPS